MDLTSLSNAFSSGGSVGNLLQNKLFLQLLASTGGAVGGKGSVAEAIGGVTNQAITSENYSKLLSKILGGGGKMTMDKDKFSLSGPSSLLGESTGIRGQMEKSASGQNTGMSPQERQPNPFLLAL